MQQAEIREVLRKKDGGKIDSYLLRSAKRKGLEGDLMNMLQTWSHSLLYHKHIYPPAAFQ